MWQRSVKRTATAGALLLLTACAEVQSVGQTAIRSRMQMNDMQARATIAANCDIAVGSYYRELKANEKKAVDLVCGGEERTDASATNGDR